MKRDDFLGSRRSVLRTGAILVASAVTSVSLPALGDAPGAMKTGLLKVDILSRRRADLTHEQYVDYWSKVHGPLFSSQPDVKRYVRRYIQSRVRYEKPAGFVLLGDVDGVAQVWFDNMDGFLALFSSPSYKNVIQPDELKFTNPSRCEFIFSTDVSFIG